MTTLTFNSTGEIAFIDLPVHLGIDVIEPLESAVADLVGHDTAKVVIVRGGDTSFNAGASRGALLERTRSIHLYVAAVPRLMLEIPVPTIAAMAGHAIGGGLTLGLWCDHVFLAEESLYGANFMALGFTPGMGTTAVVDQAFGPYLGSELLYTGRLMTGAELRSRGAVGMQILPKTAVEHAALDLARQICEATAPTLRLLKKAMAGRRRRLLERALAEELDMHEACFGDPHTRERIADRY
jgi:enoyl-CoA hydratase/carnithine racemase